jgi:hypothetical protein
VHEIEALVDALNGSVGDAGGLDLDQHLAGARAFQLNVDDFERLAGLDGDDGAGF